MQDMLIVQTCRRYGSSKLHKMDEPRLVQKLHGLDCMITQVSLRWLLAIMRSTTTING